METLDWHERLIDRLIWINKDATIADYFKITDGYKPQEITIKPNTIKN